MRWNEFLTAIGNKCWFIIPFIGFLILDGCAMHRVSSEVLEFRSNNVEKRSLAKCNGSENYIPWNGSSNESPFRTIRLNFHFMDDENHSQNLIGEEAKDFVEDLVEQANKELASNQKMRLPPGNLTEVLDPLIGYKVVKDNQGNSSIFFHSDNELYFLVNKGKDQNNYRRTVIQKYGVGLDSVVNVFVMPPHPDSMISETYGAPVTGIALRNAIKISGDFKNDREAWRYSGTFNHEVGHLLGLRHAWGNDGCDDTPRHSNCWNFTNNGSECDSLVSNNIMDSNADQDAFTPCQIGVMQRKLIRSNSEMRNYTMRDFCFPNGSEDLVIKDSVYWCIEKDLVAGIRIASGGVLFIDNRLSIPQDRGITMEKGSKLILGSQARLHNACGLKWEGIMSREKEPDILVYRGAKIEHKNFELP